MTQFDDLIYIGRFQPFHLAHLKTIEIALQQSNRLIIALGSAQTERNLKNPFFADERARMILSNFNPSIQARIQFVEIPDLNNDEKWVKCVKEKVTEKITQSETKIGLIGHFKDDSSYYLNLFSEWELVQLDSLENSISATPLREAYYQGKIETQYFPSGTIHFLNEFQHTDDYQTLKKMFYDENN